MNTPELNLATTQETGNSAASIADFGMSRLEKLAKRPNTIEETGLSESFLGDLIGKHLLDATPLPIEAGKLLKMPCCAVAILARHLCR